MLRLTPRRLVLIGVLCLALSGMLFATSYHNQHAHTIRQHGPRVAPQWSAPPLVRVQAVPRRSKAAQPVNTAPPLLISARSANTSAYNASGVPFRPAVPPYLSAYDITRVMNVIDRLCPHVNQTLIGSTGETVPSLRVVAAGMGRSGSTWQFNAIIHILREAGIVPATHHGQLPFDYAELGATLACQYSVIKCHQFHPYFLEMADYVITSHRDTRDSYASLVDVGNPEVFGHYWGEYRRWRTFACVDMRYEDFWQDQIAEIDRLIQTLPVPKSINATRVWELVEGARQTANTTKRKTGWHPVSGYHKKHVKDPEPGRWQKLLGTNNTDALYYVERMTEDWLEANGYELWFATHAHNATLPSSPFPLSRHTPLPDPISPLQTCALGERTKELGRKLRAPVEFLGDLQMWQAIQRRNQAARSASPRMRDTVK